MTPFSDQQKYVIPKTNAHKLGIDENMNKKRAWHRLKYGQAKAQREHVGPLSFCQIFFLKFDYKDNRGLYSKFEKNIISRVR